MTPHSQPNRGRLSTTLSLLGGLWVTAGLFWITPSDAQETVEIARSPAETFNPTQAPLIISAADINSRFEAELKFSDLIESEQYPEAIGVGQRLLELTEQETSPESKDTAMVLARLADIQRQVGIHDASENDFLRAIEILRSTDGLYSEVVIGPLLGLGSNYHDGGKYLEAMAVFNEARTANRRVFGLLNDGQIDILDRMTRTFSSMNLSAEAHQKQVEALRLMERKYGDDTTEVLPAIYKYARWLRSNGLYGKERSLYARAMAIIREQLSRESVYMVTPLRETGNSFRTQKLGEGQGLSSLKRAQTILESQEEVDVLAIAQTLRDLGDWYVAFSKMGPTGAEYRRAWQFLGDLENGEELRREWFDEPDYVLFVSPSRRGVSLFQQPGMEPGHVLVTFDIDEFGRTDNVAVLESIPPGLKTDSVITSIKRSRFRPRFVNGEIVPVKGLARRFVYFYKLEQ